MADEAPVKALAAGAEGPPNYPSNTTTTTSPSSSPLPTPTAAAESRSSIVRRAMEKTADKLHRSRSSTAKSVQQQQQQHQLSQSQPALPLSSSPKRNIFSLSRKGKERCSGELDGACLYSGCLYRVHRAHV